jgi:hypothetical protein
MPKSTLEFFPVTSVTLQDLKPNDSSTTGGAQTRLLSKDPDTGDTTQIIYHPPGSRWGGAVGVGTRHKYWEEVLILKGAIFDESAFSAMCLALPNVHPGSSAATTI